MRPPKLVSLPLLSTAWHQVMQFTLSAVLICGVFKWLLFKTKQLFFRTRYHRLDSHQMAPPILSMPPIPTWRRYVTQLVPCAVATALDIGLSNTSLRYISLTVYTMVKSTAPIFVVLTAWTLGLEKVDWRLIFVITIMCFGVTLMLQHPHQDADLSVEGKKEYKKWFTGVIAVFLATIMSGVRWGLTQLLLKTAHVETPTDDAGSFPLTDRPNSQFRDEESVSSISTGRDESPNRQRKSSPKRENSDRNSTSSMNSMDMNDPLRPTIQGKDRPPTRDGPILHDETIIRDALTFASVQLSPRPKSPHTPRPEDLEPASDTGQPKQPQLYTMFLLSPIMAFCLAVFSLIVERPFQSVPTNQPEEEISAVKTLALMSIGGGLAFCMIISEYWLISMTGVVTLSVAGMLKEVLTIITAIVFFHDVSKDYRSLASYFDTAWFYKKGFLTVIDSFTWLNSIGILLTLAAIGFYNYIKLKRNDAICH